MSATLLLDTESWDFVLDLAGNIAVATDPYALAQDAASAIKCFQGELYYDVNQGVPYWNSILGKWPPVSLVKQKLVDVALTVPGVVSAICYLTRFEHRQLSGQVQITDARGRTAAANF